MRKSIAVTCLISLAALLLAAALALTNREDRGRPIQGGGQLTTRSENDAAGGDRSISSKTYNLTAAERRELPDISRFISEPSPQFLVDWNTLRRGEPFFGLRAPRPHAGGHVYFEIPQPPLDPGKPESYPAIYAVADAVVTRVDEAFRLRPVYFPRLGKSVSNVRYGVGLAFATHGGRPVELHYSIEPMVDPGDPEFYKPFLLVAAGQHVRRGERIATMYIPPDVDCAESTHIHFHLMGPDGQFQSPSIFSQEVAQRFHASWPEQYRSGDAPVPPCLGCWLDAHENPFGTGAKDAL